MKSTFARLAIVSGFLATVLAGSAQTTIIAGGDPADGLTLDAAHVVTAWNLGSSSSFTVQGVFFTGMTLTGAGGDYGTGYPSGGSGDDLAFSGLMQSLAWSSTGSNLHYDFTGLTAGGQYQFQLFQTANSYASRRQGIAVNGGAATFVNVGAAAQLTTLLVNADGGGALHLTLAQSNYFSDFTGNQDGAVLSALVLTAVPEPATYAALLGLGALGLAASCRRSMNAA